ncbi:DUF2345 domain-containing protein, partial [Roseateles sp. BYS87W]
DPTRDGHHPDAVNGQDSRQPAPGSRTPDKPTPRTARPHLVLDSAASLGQITPGDLTTLAGQHLSRTSQGDQHETAAHTHHQLTGEHFSLYAHSGQLQAKAAAGPVSLQAHTDALELLADQSLQILSVNDEIHIQAKDRIELIAADSGIVLSGGDIEIKTPGTFEVKTSSHEFLGGGSQTAELVALPKGTLNESPQDIELHFHYDDLSPVIGAPYKITFEDGTVRTGALDAQGYALEKAVPKGRYRVEYGEDSRAWQPPPLAKNEAPFQQPQFKAEGQAALERMLKNEPVAAPSTAAALPLGAQP